MFDNSPLRQRSGEVGEQQEGDPNLCCPAEKRRQRLSLSLRASSKLMIEARTECIRSEKALLPWQFTSPLNLRVVKCQSQGVQLRPHLGSPRRMHGQIYDPNAKHAKHRPAAYKRGISRGKRAIRITMRFQSLFAAVFATLALNVAGNPVPNGVMTVEQMKNFLATTDANLTFTGLPIEMLGVDPLVTTLTVCSTRTAQLCSGPCTVFTGTGTCFNTPNTNCLAATTDVAFCDHSNCGGSCNTLSTCGTRLDDGFCYTPGTNSVSVPN
ncbi:hypothetical protein MSAN_02066800 [Mycena sanguinolenta]|uniref:Uncharacterized protein n=1 Tax=Mycena sanguinolenta TaxID=230812 RepID=A0A8H6XHM9_9AGAR|nr:hypothetical protein MSAN_02066800 [Mycena sanguinolenta]